MPPGRRVTSELLRRWRQENPIENKETETPLAKSEPAEVSWERIRGGGSQVERRLQHGFVELLY